MVFQILFKGDSQYLNFNLRVLANFLTSVHLALVVLIYILLKLGFHYLTEEDKNYQIPLPVETLVVQDGHPVFYYMKEVPENVIKICSNVFDMMPKTGTFIFSPDSYEPGSVKSLKRKQWGCGKKLIIEGDRAIKGLQIGNNS